MKLTKARIKQLKRLQGRLRYENRKAGAKVYQDTSLATLNVAFRQLSQDKRNRVKQRKVERAVANASKAVRRYNENIAKTRASAKIHDFIDATTFTKKPEQIKKLVKVINKIKATPRGKTLAKVKEALKPFVKFKKGQSGGEQSISLATATVVNKQRKIRGDITIYEEVYYFNFLKATLRVGAYRLYARAKEAGVDHVSDLYARGFAIPEVYVINDIDTDTPPYASDKELRDMGIDIDNPTTFPTIEKARKMKSTEYGRELGKYAAKLIRRKL